jgi:hypothetical protein
VDWSSIVRLTQEAFRTAVNEWIGSARVQGGKAMGPSAILPPGSLAGDVNIEMRVLQLLTGSDVPQGIAAALGKVLGGAWNDWAAGFQMQLPAAYPAFAAFPGPVAPPTPAAPPLLVAMGSSPGEASLRAPALTRTLLAALRMYPTRLRADAPEQPIGKLAAWVESSFNDWKSLATLSGLRGRGPVPTFAPPYVPVGPVVMGETFSSAPLFAGPRFGKVVL